MVDLLPYVRIARFDHWFKNVFVLPGCIVAFYARPELLGTEALWNVLVALLATGIIASSIGKASPTLAPRNSVRRCSCHDLFIAFLLTRACPLTQRA